MDKKSIPQNPIHGLHRVGDIIKELYPKLIFNKNGNKQNGT